MAERAVTQELLRRGLCHQPDPELNLSSVTVTVTSGSQSTSLGLRYLLRNGGESYTGFPGQLEGWPGHGILRTMQEPRTESVRELSAPGMHTFFQISVSGLFEHNPQKWDRWVKRQIHFNFLRYLHTAFHTWNAPVCIPTNSAPFSTSSPTLVVGWFANDSHSDTCEMTSQCGFNLHFSD